MFTFCHKGGTVVSGPILIIKKILLPLRVFTHFLFVIKIYKYEKKCYYDLDRADLMVEEGRC